MQKVHVLAEVKGMVRRKELFASIVLLGVGSRWTPVHMLLEVGSDSGRFSGDEFGSIHIMDEGVQRLIAVLRGQ
ncbi:MAG: hypothetical protein KW804_01750 [Candidatus Doudnabacteria bacterium]|nr:hypothetical protein [Candidatus Doudnabacteria bacterium]